MFASLSPRALGLDLPPSEAIDLAASADFAGVDLGVRDLDGLGPRPAEIRQRMDDLGLIGGSFPLPVDWRLTHQRKYERELKQLPRYAEVAATIGLMRTGTWVLPDWPRQGVSTPAHAPSVLRYHHERLGPIAEILAGFGIRLGLEPIGVLASRTPGDRRFITGPRDLELKLLVERLDATSGRRTTGLTADSFHLHAAAEPSEAALALGVERVVAVHLADLPADFEGDRDTIQDGDRGLPGERGPVDSAGLLRVLQRAGYRGPVIAEPMAACRSLAVLPALERARAARASLRRVWPAD